MPAKSGLNSLLRNLTFVALIAWVGWQYFQDQGGFQNPSDLSTESSNRELLQAVQQQQSDVWLVAQGKVKQVLRDDTEGSRHQRFIVNIAPGLTILVAHNIDLARRVPLSAGDPIRLRGEYEWNSKGGVIHWTHRDPAGRRAGGWIEHNNKRYN